MDDPHVFGARLQEARMVSPYAARMLWEVAGSTVEIEVVSVTLSALLGHKVEGQPHPVDAWDDLAHHVWWRWFEATMEEGEE